MSEMTTISGGITHFPKLKELKEDDVILEKGKYVGNGENKFGGTNYFFESATPITTDKGETSRVGLSAGQIATAMENEGTFGGWYKIVYKGSKAIQEGQWKDQQAHTFLIQRYKDEATTKTAAATDAQTDLPLTETTATTTAETKENGDLNVIM